MIKNWFKILPFIIPSAALFVCTHASIAFGTGNVSIGLSGYGSNNNAGLERYETTSGSVNLSIAAGRYVQFGLVHRRAFEHRHGLKYDTSQEAYYKFKNDVDSATYALNATLILYQGIVSPYIFGGVAKKYYTYKFTYDFDSPIVHTTKFTLPYSPNYGFGFAFRLNRDFSLKISQTYSKGRLIRLNEAGEEEEEDAIDTYTQVGISYNLI